LVNKFFSLIQSLKKQFLIISFQGRNNSPVRRNRQAAAISHIQAQRKCNMVLPLPVLQPMQFSMIVPRSKPAGMVFAPEKSILPPLGAYLREITGVKPD
jgi:hypothetical protein